MFPFVRLTMQYILDVANMPLSINIVKYLKLKQTNANLMLIARTDFSH